MKYNFDETGDHRQDGSIRWEQPEGRDHFGLNNIYRRLMACYGTEANISFVSIPYLKNSVIVAIPYDRNEFSNTP